MRKSDILAKLRQMSVDAVALQHRANGIKAIYTGCVMSGDSKGADTHRQELHEILDMQLDLEASTTMLSRSFMEANED